MPTKTLDISASEIASLEDAPDSAKSLLGNLSKSKAKSSKGTKSKGGILADLQREKQAEISQVVEVIEADRLFEKAAPKIRALAEPRMDVSAEKFRALILELTTQGVEVSEGIPGVRDLWREIERACGRTNRSQYFVDPTEIRADVKYRLLTQLSKKSSHEAIFILTGLVDKKAYGEAFGIDATNFATRQTFIRRVLRNSARTVSRRTKGWVGLEALDREANNKATAEETNARVWDSKLGKRFSPKPWIAHLPLGKVDIAPHDLIDGSNEKVAPLVHGLANFWMKAAFLAAAPKFDKAVLEEAVKLAAVHYKNELNMLATADSVIYPKGGPSHIPGAVTEGNEREFEVRWLLQTRTKYADRTMIPYLGQHGYVKKFTGPSELVAKRLKEEAIKAMGHVYAGRLDCVEDDRNFMPADIGVAWKDMNRGVMKLEEGTVSYSSVPATIKKVMVKEMRKAVSEPWHLLKSPPVSLPQPPKTPKEMIFHDFISQKWSIDEMLEIGADRVAGMGTEEIMAKYNKRQAKKKLLLLAAS